MRDERRAIFGLVATGRISARQAERLLLAAGYARDEFWIAVACLSICAAQLHTGLELGWLGHAIGQIIQFGMSGWKAVGHAITNAAGALLSQGMGGTI